MIKNMKKNEGVTLIALVVTIIILLILAVVSFSVLFGNEGLIEKTKKAAVDYENEALVEAISLAILDIKVDGDGLITEEKIRNAIENRIGNNDFIITPNPGTGGWTIKIKDKEFTVTSNGEVKKNSDNSSSSNGGSNGNSGSNTPDFSLKVGDEVIVRHNGVAESFYVLEEPNANQNEVVLLAKYCISQDATRQYPSFSYDTSCKFASSLYWNSDYLEWYPDKADGRTRYNVNNSTGNGAGDAITRAKTYAATVGGTNGRLLTYEEVLSIVRKENGEYVFPEMAQKIWGEVDIYREKIGLNYWLASAGNETRYEGQGFSIEDEESYQNAGEGVYVVAGEWKNVYAMYYDPGALWGNHPSDYNSPGVRPVVTVSKDKIEKPTNVQPTNYMLGQEIELTYNNIKDNFYVLSDNGDSLTVLAKYCLNSRGRQLELDMDQDYYSIDYSTGVFSQNVYWDNAAKNWLNSQSNNDTVFNVNNVETSGIYNTMTEARNYATTVGGTNGRLLTYEEIQTYLSNPITANMVRGISKERAFYYYEDYDSMESLSYWTSSIDLNIGTIWVYKEGVRESTRTRWNEDYTLSWEETYNEEYADYFDEDGITSYDIYYMNSYGSISSESVDVEDPYMYESAGVRPVITIPKSSNIRIIDDSNWPTEKLDQYKYINI